MNALISKGFGTHSKQALVPFGWAHNVGGCYESSSRVKMHMIIKGEIEFR